MLDGLPTIVSPRSPCVHAERTSGVEVLLKVLALLVVQVVEGEARGHAVLRGAGRRALQGPRHVGGKGVLVQAVALARPVVSPVLLLYQICQPLERLRARVKFCRQRKVSRNQVPLLPISLINRSFSVLALPVAEELSCTKTKMKMGENIQM